MNTRFERYVDENAWVFKPIIFVMDRVIAVVIWIGRDLELSKAESKSRLHMTVLECLIVLAILAGLIALILPALNSDRSREHLGLPSHQASVRVVQLIILRVS